MKMLVVASPTLSPLSTDGPIPTDGQPVWSRCIYCQSRVIREPGPSPRECWHNVNRSNQPGGHVYTRDGPFPFPVAVWQEGDPNCPECNGTRTIRLGTEELGEDVSCIRCDYHGAVVAAVEVTGKGHHADDCAHDAPGPVHGFPQGRVREVERRYCRPDALPDHWHPPTGHVTKLDVPIPMERPPVGCPGPASPQTFHREWSEDCPECGPGGPVSWWWADIDPELLPATIHTEGS